MSEKRDLWVPVLVILCGLGVAAWDVSSGAVLRGIAAGVLGLVVGSTCLQLALARKTVRGTFLAVAGVLIAAALSPVFPGNEAAMLSLALVALACAYPRASIPETGRYLLLGLSGVLAVTGLLCALKGVPLPRQAGGLLLAGAFAAALNVFTSRPRPVAPPPVGPTVGVFGGSFDPFHESHRQIVEAALPLLNRVLVVVAGHPPHKEGKEITPFHHRVAMSRLGVEGLPRTEVLEIEGRKDGPSYTIDTLAKLQRMYPPGSTFHLLIGGDSFQDFPLWKDWEGILDRATLLVAARPGADTEAPPEFEGRNVPVRWLDLEPKDVSSTEIRRRVAAGESLSDLVSPAIEAYIRDHALYGSPASLGARGGDAPPAPEQAPA